MGRAGRPPGGVAPAGPVHSACVMCYTVTHDVTSSQRPAGLHPDDALLDAARDEHPRRRLAPDHADRRGRRAGRLADDDLPPLARHADAARRPADPRVGRRLARARRGRRLADRDADRGTASRRRSTALRGNELFAQDRRRRPRAAAALPARAPRPQPGRGPRGARRGGRGRPGATARCATATRPLLARACCSRRTASCSRCRRWPTTTSPRPASTGAAAAGRAVPRPVSVSSEPVGSTRARRAPELAEARRRREVDVLVVGLGVTGAGVALDAASRGLSVVAVDAHDLAFGTSRWSSKLVHGGLRYLANGQVGVAHESAVERGILMTRTAPHLTRALPMLMPLLPALAAVAGPPDLGRAPRPATCCGAAARTPRSVLPRPRRLSAHRDPRAGPRRPRRRAARRPAVVGRPARGRRPARRRASPAPPRRTAPAS